MAVKRKEQENEKEEEEEEEEGEGEGREGVERRRMTGRRGMGMGTMGRDNRQATLHATLQSECANKHLTVKLLKASWLRTNFPVCIKNVNA